MNKAKWIAPAVLVSSLVAGVALAKGGAEAPRLFDRVEQNEKGKQDRPEAAQERMAQGMAKKDAAKRRASAGMDKGHAKAKANEQRGKKSKRSRHDSKRRVGGEKLFEKLDVNRDGIITSSEAGRKANGWLRKLDTNGDGAVTRAEMMAAKGLAQESHEKRGKRAHRDQNENRPAKHENKGKSGGGNKSKKR